MGLKSSYDPKTQIPSLSGKTILVTGGTAGLGKETIRALSQHNPDNIYFTGRNKDAANTVVSEMKNVSSSTTYTFIECDQTSLVSVQSAAKKFLASASRLDVLLCNAGIMGVPPELTKDGFEIQFGVNYLAHALLMKLLIPVLERTATEHGEARIVSLSSEGFRNPPKGGIAFNTLKSTQDDLGMFAKWQRYGQSKLAQVLQTRQLAKHHPSIKSICIHPGVIMTGLVNNLPLGDRIFVKALTWGQGISPEEGAYNSCWAATTEDKANCVSGGLYKPVGIKMPDSNYSKDEKLAEKLWEWTSETLKDYD